MADGGSIAIETVWRSRIQTTDAPQLTPHDIWTLEIRLHGSTPLRLASVIHSKETLSWALVEAGPEPSSEHVEAAIAIRPWGWSATEERVEIRVVGLGATFADRALLDSPRSHLEIVAPDTASSGALIPILLVPAHTATFGLLAVDANDTEARRGRRWRLRPDRVENVDPRFAALASGHQSGRSTD